MCTGGQRCTGLGNRRSEQARGAGAGLRAGRQGIFCNGKRHFAWWKNKLTSHARTIECWPVPGPPHARAGCRIRGGGRRFAKRHGRPSEPESDDMLPTSSDVVVIGAGNAALCAGLAAAESGASVLVLERAPEARIRRQQPLHRRRLPLRLRRRRGPQGADARPDRGRDQEHRLRHLHRGAVLRRHGPRHRVPHRPRAVRAAGHAQQGDHAVDARQGHPLRADLRPAGIQGRRQVQVLGRADGRVRGRRPGPGGRADQGGDEGRRHGRLRDARAVR